MKLDKRYFFWGLTAFCVVAVCVVFAVIVTNLRGFFDVISGAFNIFLPILLGVLFAYLLNPLVNAAEKFLLPRLQKRKKIKNAAKLSRALSVLFSVIVGLAVLVAFLTLILPQLYDTIVSLVGNLPVYYEQIVRFFSRVLADNPELQTRANAIMDSFYKFLETFLTEHILGDMQNIMVGVTNSVMAVIRAVLDVLIGFVASIYMLISKDTFRAQSKKLTVAVFRPKTADRILHIGRETHRIFSGFIVGKLIDSLIIGVLCYIGMAILRLPFAVLISVIVGVTNVIPFFGPIFGIVPSALLILIVNPLQALYFVIFAVILQQLDGNVIGPRILGDSIGISGFWILVSITVAGKLFGFVGMLLGVPVFGVLYVLIRDAINGALKRKKHTAAGAAYRDIRFVEELDAEQDPPEETSES